MGLISRVSSRTYRSYFCHKQKPFKKSKWPKDVFMSEESSPVSEVVSNNNTKTKLNGTWASESPTFTNLKRTPRLSTKKNLDLELFGARLCEPMVMLVLFELSSTLTCHLWLEVRRLELCFINLDQIDCKISVLTVDTKNN